jgi:hypothetical protein
LIGDEGSGGSTGGIGSIESGDVRSFGRPNGAGWGFGVSRTVATFTGGPT